MDAGQFNEKLVKQEPEFYMRVLMSQLDYYFFSHLGVIQLKLKPQHFVLEHFYDFFQFIETNSMKGTIQASYALFYVLY